MWHNLNNKDIQKSLKTDFEIGLTENEAKRRGEKYGKNKLKDKPKESIIIKFINQFNDFMIIILIVASIVSAMISFFQGEKDYFDSIIIIFIVVFNAIIGLVQEEKAEKSIEALKELTPQLAKVIRNNKIKKVKSEELVPGDLIILEAGDNVPADCRIMESNGLKIEESSLTGETEPVNKKSEPIYGNDTKLNYLNNMAYMSTVVINGHGKAIVTETGMNTKVGKIANIMIESSSPETPIQKRLKEVGKILGTVCLIICAVVFVIGIFKKVDKIEMFMTSVGLAVAAIPEGLPAIVTIMLSIGVTKMAKKHSIIRKLQAVETLGCSNVICSDKTGTLTQNKMEVVKIQGEDQKLILELAAMCTDCVIENDRGKIKVEGDPTEVALVNAGLNINKNKDKLYSTMKRISDIPFNSDRKLMSTIHLKDNNYRIITKGAPEILIEKCNRIYKDGKIITIEENDINKIMDYNKIMANHALRVIAVAYSDIKELPKKIDEKSIEKNLIFTGLIGMIDPPRRGVKESVRICNKAGIRTIMITGDHIETAKAIAKDIGILNNRQKAITGFELDKISQNELEKVIKDYSVFARVTPEHKVRIVKAWQSTGAVVAMTGDGVNDAPALKGADIGIAMGKNGTDVAKSASDMILTDDNFVTIVEAIKQGRTIYDNIKKAIHFLIATNIGEIVTIFIGLILGIKNPLYAIQLLWINLVTDSIPSIALGLEPAEEEIMERKPIDSKKGIFADGLWSQIILEGIMIGMITIFTFSIGNRIYNESIARTMTFLSLGLLELIHSFNVKSGKSIFKTNLLNNMYLIGSFVLGSIIQIAVVIIPTFANIFKLVQLNMEQWIITIIMSLLPIPIIEFQKKLNEIKFGRVIYNTRKIKMKKSEVTNL